MSKKVLIVGSVAAGAKAASRIIRRKPEFEVTILDGYGFKDVKLMDAGILAWPFKNVITE